MNSQITRKYQTLLSKLKITSHITYDDVSTLSSALQHLHDDVNAINSIHDKVVAKAKYDTFGLIRETIQEKLVKYHEKHLIENVDEFVKVLGLSEKIVSLANHNPYMKVLKIDYIKSEFAYLEETYQSLQNQFNFLTSAEFQPTVELIKPNIFSLLCKDGCQGPGHCFLRYMLLPQNMDIADIENNRSLDAKKVRRNITKALLKGIEEFYVSINKTFEAEILQISCIEPFMTCLNKLSSELNIYRAYSSSEMERNFGEIHNFLQTKAAKLLDCLEENIPKLEAEAEKIAKIAKNVKKNNIDSPHNNPSLLNKRNRIDLHDYLSTTKAQIAIDKVFQKLLLFIADKRSLELEKLFGFQILCSHEDNKYPQPASSFLSTVYNCENFPLTLLVDTQNQANNTVVWGNDRLKSMPPQWQQLNIRPLKIPSAIRSSISMILSLKSFNVYSIFIYIACKIAKNNPREIGDELYFTMIQLLESYFEVLALIFKDMQENSDYQDYVDERPTNTQLADSKLDIQKYMQNVNTLSSLKIYKKDSTISALSSHHNLQNGKQKAELQPAKPLNHALSNLQKKSNFIGGNTNVGGITYKNVQSSIYVQVEEMNLERLLREQPSPKFSIFIDSFKMFERNVESRKNFKIIPKQESHILYDHWKFNLEPIDYKMTDPTGFALFFEPEPQLDRIILIKVDVEKKKSIIYGLDNEIPEVIFKKFQMFLKHMKHLFKWTNKPKFRKFKKIFVKVSGLTDESFKNYYFTFIPLYTMTSFNPPILNLSASDLTQTFESQFDKGLVQCGLLRAIEEDYLVLNTKNELKTFYIENIRQPKDRSNLDYNKTPCERVLSIIERYLNLVNKALKDNSIELVNVIIVCFYNIQTVDKGTERNCIFTHLVHHQNQKKFEIIGTDPETLQRVTEMAFVDRKMAVTQTKLKLSQEDMARMEESSRTICILILNQKLNPVPTEDIIMNRCFAPSMLWEHLLVVHNKIQALKNSIKREVNPSHNEKVVPEQDYYTNIKFFCDGLQNEKVQKKVVRKYFQKFGSEGLKNLYVFLPSDLEGLIQKNPDEKAFQNYIKKLSPEKIRSLDGLVLFCKVGAIPTVYILKVYDKQELIKINIVDSVHEKVDKRIEIDGFLKLLSKALQVKLNKMVPKAYNYFLDSKMCNSNEIVKSLLAACLYNKSQEADPNHTLKFQEADTQTFFSVVSNSLVKVFKKDNHIASKIPKRVVSYRDNWMIATTNESQQRKMLGQELLNNYCSFKSDEYNLLMVTRFEPSFFNLLYVTPVAEDKFRVKSFTFTTFDRLQNFKDVFKDFFENQRVEIEFNIQSCIYVMHSFFPLFANTNLKLIGHLMALDKTNKSISKIEDGSLFEEMISNPGSYFEYIQSRFG